jgi:hypothetical protein
MLQFHVSNRLGTTFTWHGLALAESTGLKLVYREADGPTESLEGDSQKLIIPWDAIDRIERQAGWFGVQVRIVLKPQHALPTGPLMHNSELILEIHRSRTEQIEPFLQRAEHFRVGGRALDADTVIDEAWKMLDEYRGPLGENPS